MATASTLQRIQSYQNVLKPWSDGGVERLRRNWEFINLSTSNKAIYGGSASAVILGSAFSGAIVGEKIGGISGRVIADETGEEIGKKVGYVVGFTAGGGVGVYLYVNYTESTSAYTLWIKEIKDMVLEEECKTQYEQDDILVNNICPISQSLMVLPVRLPTGHLFDGLSIDRIAPDANRMITCPMTRELISVDSLTIDIERGLVIQKRIRNLLQHDIAAAQGNPPLLALLGIRQQKNKEALDNFYNKALDDIENRRIKGKISFTESQSERDEFAKVFGETAEAELDWSQDWKDILKSRWLKVHPEIPVFDSNEV